MSLLTAEAIILASRPFRETSRIVTLLAAGEGLLSGIAKGARSPGNRFGAGLELFSHSQVVLYFKRQRDLQLIVESDPLRSFAAIWEDTDRYLAASAGTEFLMRVLAPAEPSRAIFGLTLEFLGALEAEISGNRSFTLRAFQLQACDLLGLRPELAHCVVCGGSERLTAFAPLEGGLVCGACAGSIEQPLPLSANAIALLRGLMATPLAEAASRLAPSHGAGSPARREAARAIESFLRFHIERYAGLRSLDALLRVRRAGLGPPGAAGQTP
jgi:DNA repair protein RecO (recombination protein O)